MCHCPPGFRGRGKDTALTLHSRMQIWQGLQDPPVMCCEEVGACVFCVSRLTGEISALLGSKVLAPENNFKKTQKTKQLYFIWGKGLKEHQRIGFYSQALAQFLKEEMK